MKIVAFEGQGGPRLGVVDGDTVVDLNAVDSAVPTDLGEWLKRNDGDTKPLADIAKRAAAAARRPLSGLTYRLPIGRPGKVICLGLNYLAHVKEGAQRDNIPKFPTIFMRSLTSLVPHGQPIIRPQVTETLDYEAEMILIVGRRAKHLTAANALSCVAGYSCGNEGSVREFQRKTTQWDMGKNFDHTGGFGPWLVSADELPPGGKGLKIESRLNGRVMQSDNTDNMMFPIAEMLVYITQGMTLEPGDIIFTGTPSGVGFARQPPVWMKNGDVCEVEIQGIGVLRNPIVDEKIGRGPPMADKTFDVISICGSLRKGSYNRMVMNALPGLAPAGMRIKEAPPFSEFPLYNADLEGSGGIPPAVQRLADAIRAADGVIFNTPEYNFSIPGGLKNAIDWVSRVPNQPFASKPVAIQSATGGPLGGGRMQYDLRRAMLFLDALTFGRPEIFIGNCSQRIDAKTGEITDQQTIGFIRQQLAAFATFIEQHSGKR